MIFYCGLMVHITDTRAHIWVKARFSYGCIVAEATYIQWSKILNVCNIARVQAGYVI